MYSHCRKTTFDMLLVMFLLICVNGVDEQHLAPGHSDGQCSPDVLETCSELLTRALDKHDLGFVTTESGLNSLCK